MIDGVMNMVEAKERTFGFCFGAKVKEYKIIYADPAWVYQDKANAGNRGAEHKYKCTPTDQMGDIIKNIPVSKDSVCLMWCTYPQLAEGLKLMELWGFKFKTVAFHGLKRTRKAIHSF